MIVRHNHEAVFGNATDYNLMFDKLLDNKSIKGMKASSDPEAHIWRLVWTEEYEMEDVE